MAEKILNSRIINKHDTEENWLKATGFTPKQGELIVYDIDNTHSYERIKIGDGVQNVNDLPFYAGSWEDLSDRPFGSVAGQDYIVEEQSIVLGKAMGGTETYVFTTRPFSEFAEDTVYYVVFDGEVYPVEYDSDLDGLNVDAVDLEIYYGGNDEMTVFTASSDPRKGATHTFGMYVSELVTAQLDEKYIPDTIARMSDIPITNTSLSVAGAPADAKATGDAIDAVNTRVDDVSELVGDTSVSEQIEAAQIVYVGPTQPTDTNIKVWINTAEEGTGVVPVLPRVATISLPAASWTGSASPYYQTVSINTVTSATKIDLQPTVAQITSLQNADIALMAENTNGTVKVYSFGGKPSADMTMQALLTEVSYV